MEPYQIFRWLMFSMLIWIIGAEISVFVSNETVVVNDTEHIEQQHHDNSKKLELCPDCKNLIGSINLDDFLPNETCSNIDLISVDSSEEYAHCRIVTGYVALRQLDIAAHQIALSFPKLEVITEFLLLHQITSTAEERSLSTIFPRLRYILGQRQVIMGVSLYISHYYASDSFSIDSLEAVCGAVKMENSPMVCIRHSPFYWRLLPHSKELTLKMNQIESLKLANLTVTNRTDQYVKGRLNLQFYQDRSYRHMWKNLQTYRIVVFAIDQLQFDYIAGKKILSPDDMKCTEPIDTQTFLLDNIFNSDNQNLFLERELKDQLDHPKPLYNFSFANLIFTQPIFKHKVSPDYSLFNGLKFDFSSIFMQKIPVKSYNKAEMFNEYKFRFHVTYIIKIMSCFGETFINCLPTKFLSFKLPKNDAQGASNTDNSTNGIGSLVQHTAPVLVLLRWPNLISVILIIVALIVSMFAFIRARQHKTLFKVLHRIRLRRFRVSMVSVNPEYMPINSVWSWDPLLDASSVRGVNCEINRSQLTILTHRLLGKGEFGYVHEGILFDCEGLWPGHAAALLPSFGAPLPQFNHTNGQKSSLRVAIKQLRENANAADKERFITEAKYMKTFQSNFLVKFIGVCTKQEPLLVVMEYMENGDLKRFLRQKYKEFQEKNQFDVIPIFDLVIRMAIQIADGMYYLHSKRILHRDLAARNCMVSQDLTVKIGDFGLTRNVYEKEYYRLSDQAPMPLRWMAPESVSKMIFTPQTDVWSFGVVLWEIMCFGEQPYKGLSDIEAKQAILSCVHLNRPFYFIPVIWNVAKKCWNKSPKRRPDFKTIIELLLPHLDKCDQRAQFESMSYYHLSQLSGMPGTGGENDRIHRSLSQIITERCYELVAKLYSNTSQQTNKHHQQQQQQQQQSDQQLNMKQNQQLHYQSCPCVAPALTTSLLALASNVPTEIGKTVVGCTLHQQLSPNKTRCQSFDSMQSIGTMVTNDTAETAISCDLEPTTQSRHNSTGSENAPLI